MRQLQRQGGVVGRLVIVAALLLAMVGTWSAPARAAQGGPIVLMGIDAEDGGPGGHGPITVYVDVVNSILNSVTNGGNGILVLGGGDTNITNYWNAISTNTGEPVTLVNGASNIQSQSFTGYAMLAVVSDENNTFGGLTLAENTALGARKGDVAAFLNNGGGLLGFSSANFGSEAYPYLGDLGSFTFGSTDYDDITPTSDGTATGITDALDVCCWHDEFLTFPSFLKVLATNPSTGNAAAIGGANVVISDIELAPDGTSSNVGTSHTVTATVKENNQPAPNKTVDFTILSGPHAGITGSSLTDASGQATFSYTGTVVGTDTIEAAFTDSSNNRQTSNQVTHEWIQTNQPPQANAGGSYSGLEGSAIALSGTASDPDQDPLTISWTYTADSSVDAGATCAITNPSSLTPTITCTDDGLYNVVLTVDDGVNDPATESTAVMVLSNAAPDILNIQADELVKVTNSKATVNLQADLTDPGSNDTHSCEVNWDDGSTSTAAASGGACSMTHDFLAAGVYTISVTATDDDGDSDSESVTVVVYDPSAGFVTGGGWITSPAGAYTADPSLTGKASFGFVSMNRKGAQVPFGMTNFQLHVDNFNFHSARYQWLVVSGAKAQYKGTGRVNGQAGYDFLVTVIDSQVAGGGTVDKFRIKIWNANGVVYDNAPGASDDIDKVDPQALQGGYIIIHNK